MSLFYFRLNCHFWLEVFLRSGLRKFRFLHNMIGEGCNVEVVFILQVKFQQVAYFLPGGLKVIVIYIPGD